MPEAVKHPRLEGLLFLLFGLSLFVLFSNLVIDPLERARVLLLEAAGFNMFALGRGREYPTFFGLLSG